MKPLYKFSVLLLVVAAAAGTLVMKTSQRGNEPPTGPATENSVDPQSPTRTQPDEPQRAIARPKLLDLGADKCVPCKMMAPILEDLKKEYEAQLDVQFIDVWKNPDAGDEYGIQVIPTQIFYDPSGKELFRHTGYFSKDDILGKWRELGFDFTPSSGL